MALIVITVMDGEKGVDVGVQMEPAINTDDPNMKPTGAQLLAMDMLGLCQGIRTDEKPRVEPLNPRIIKP